MMPDLTTLKEPVFIEANWEELYREIISAYENVSGVKLSKGQLESILLSIFAYRENLLRILMNETAKQNLLAYATSEKLEHLGALFGISRLPARKAITTLRFYFSEPLSESIVIPQGTRVMSKDQKVIFATDETVNVPASSQFIDVPASCEEAGVVGNGYLMGDINLLIDPIPLVESVENISISYGGADIEDDEHLRARIQLAPEAFSNAGSKGAYEFWARTAHQDIEDVAVTSPKPGQVKVVVLMKGGESPSQEVMDLVSKTLNDEKVRPLTDIVTVSAPKTFGYEISAKLYLHRKSAALSDPISEKAKEALESYANLLKRKLGRDIVPEQMISILQSINGVYRVVLDSPPYKEISPDEHAECTGINVQVAGVVDD